MYKCILGIYNPFHNFFVVKPPFIAIAHQLQKNCFLLPFPSLGMLYDNTFHKNFGRNINNDKFIFVEKHRENKKHKKVSNSVASKFIRFFFGAKPTQQI